MSHTPSLKPFVDLADSVDYVPVYRRLMSDALTPVQAFRKLDTSSAACLFESVIGGEKVGRYSFLASDPFLLLSAYANQVTISHATISPSHAKEQPSAWTTESFECSNPLETLREHVQKMNVAHFDDLPPFVGGAVGYAGYDTVRYAERLPNAPHDDRKLPDLWFAFYDQMVVFDHVQKTIIVLALAEVRGKDEAATEKSYEAACGRVDRLVEQLDAPDQSLPLADIQTGGEVTLDTTSNFTQAEYEDAVRKCVEYIRAGDIFQVVISQRLQVPFELPPFELYRTLRIVNPSPFMFYLRTPEVTLVGSSNHGSRGRRSRNRQAPRRN